jgi:hypothetical protein
VKIRETADDRAHDPGDRLPAVESLLTGASAAGRPTADPAGRIHPTVVAAETKRKSASSAEVNGSALTLAETTGSMRGVIGTIAEMTDVTIAEMIDVTNQMMIAGISLGVCPKAVREKRPLRRNECPSIRAARQCGWDPSLKE